MGRTSTAHPAASHIPTVVLVELVAGIPTDCMPGAAFVVVAAVWSSSMLDEQMGRSAKRSPMRQDTRKDSAAAVPCIDFASSVLLEPVISPLFAFDLSQLGPFDLGDPP